MSNSLADIDVFILCGGLGKRLRKISKNNPKPMMKIGDHPFIDIIINYMARFGFKRFILGVGYKADVMTKYYKNKNILGINMVFSGEKTPLDTGGAVKKAKKFIKSNPFLVLNGDSFCRFNPRQFLKFHQKNKALITILLKKVADGKEYGEVKIDRSSRVISYNEKDNSARNCLVNAGIYIFDKKVFNLMPSSAEFSLERCFFPMLIGNRIFGYAKSGFFIDIGTPDRLRKARRIFSGNKRTN